MAAPATFPEANGILNAPRGVPPEACGDLPVHCDGGSIHSAWSLTWRERLSVLLFGRVWLSVQARDTHSPVALRACRQLFQASSERAS